MQLVWADQGYTGAFAAWLRESRGWRLDVVRHPEAQRWRYGLEERPRGGFRVLPRGGGWSSARSRGSGRAAG